MPIKTNKKVFPLFLWLLKAGAFSNLFFLAQTFREPLISAAPQALLPAQVLLPQADVLCTRRRLLHPGTRLLRGHSGRGRSC